MLTQNEVLKALRNVMDPDLGKDIVSLNFVRDIRIEGGRVSFKLVLTTPACPLKAKIEGDARSAVSSIKGVKEIVIETGSEVPSAKTIPEKESIKGVKNTIAVASGKGGAGKTSISTAFFREPILPAL